MHQISDAQMREMATSFIGKLNADELATFAADNNVGVEYLHRVKIGLNKPPKWLLEHIGIRVQTTRTVTTTYFVQ